MKWENYLGSHLVIAYIEDKSICIFLKNSVEQGEKEQQQDFSQ